MFSYRLALKFNDFHEARSGLLDLLIVFKACGSSIYFKNVSVALAQIDYLENIGHPVFDLMVDDISAFVEEPGEIAFGMLGTLESRSGKQPDNFDSVRNNFRLLNTYIKTFSKLSGDDEQKPSKFTVYEDESQETVMLNEWIAGLLDKTILGTFTPYNLLKYKTYNVPNLKEVVFSGTDFICTNVAEENVPVNVFKSVEETIANVHRLWRGKRKAAESRPLP